jgi:hypothetical protein
VICCMCRWRCEAMWLDSQRLQTHRGSSIGRRARYSSSVSSGHVGERLPRPLCRDAGPSAMEVLGGRTASLGNRPVTYPEPRVRPACLLGTCWLAALRAIFSGHSAAIHAGMLVAIAHLA